MSSDFLFIDFFAASLIRCRLKPEKPAAMVIFGVVPTPVAMGQVYVKIHYLLSPLFWIFI
jgi:hypothetical protein